jgi:hypothetical protein
MPRPPDQPQRSDIPLHELEDYDNVVGRFARNMAPGEWRVPSPYFQALLNSPPLAAPLTSIGRRVRQRGEYDNTYSHADREFVDQVLYAEWGLNAFKVLHTEDALSAGVRPEAIAALADGHEKDLTDDERLLATYIRQVVSGTVTDATYAAMESRLGQRGTVEYTIFIALLQLIFRLHQAFGCPEDSDEAVARILDGFKDGTVELPDLLARIR